ncbi:MAG TPA: lysylphosphatidylglycerol synthase transmembrane domain-containing protein [Terriglobales bacterium]|nr:lysylphosphatidylglycerol synthase transmembrane domain-containing protein [Terriglobales bacterium]
MKGSPRKGLLDWKVGVGLALSVAALWWAFHGVDFSEVVREISGADPVWFIASVIAATSLFYIRAVRWHWMLEPIRAGIPYRPRLAATCIGFMANNLLPARIGEFVRAFALGRITGMPVSAAFGSLVVERLLDGIIVVGFLFAAMAAPSFPEVGGGDLALGARVMLALIVAAGLVLIGIVLRPDGAVRIGRRIGNVVLPEAFRRPVVDAFEALVHGFAVLRSPRLMAVSLAWSIILWGVGALAFWLAFRAFDIDVPFTAAVFLQSVVALGVSLPSAPGFFGPFEAAAKFGLVGVYGIEEARALGFALGFHLGGFVPITLIGLWYAWRVGLSSEEVLHSEEAVEEEVEEETTTHPPLA